jgi:hypothetical protein
MDRRVDVYSDSSWPCKFYLLHKATRVFFSTAKPITGRAQWPKKRKFPIWSNVSEQRGCSLTRNLRLRYSRPDPLDLSPLCLRLYCSVASECVAPAAGLEVAVTVCNRPTKRELRASNFEACKGLVGRTTRQAPDNSATIARVMSTRTSVAAASATSSLARSFKLKPQTRSPLPARLYPPRTVRRTKTL